MIDMMGRVSIVSTVLLVLLAAGGCPVKTGPVGQADDTKKLACLIANDFYAVHLTAYQPPAGRSGGAVDGGFRPYCQELPSAGRTYITLDLLDQDVRTTPLAVRVQSHPDEGQPSTISELPRRVYPAGVVEVVADLPRPGRYSVVLQVGDSTAGEDIITIPMTVASPYALASVLPYALLALVVVAGGVALLPRLRLVGAPRGDADPWNQGGGSI
jgi:hypothetical protein